MEKTLNIPFIKSRGFECGQACAAMMIKYFYPDFEPDFKEFNRLTRHQKGKYTFPLQNVLLLDHYRVKAKCFSKDDYKTTKEDPKIFKKWYGEEYEQQMKFVDIDSYNWMCLETRKKNLFEQRKTSFNNILNFFKKDWLVCFCVDWHTLKAKKGAFQGHFVLLSGVKGDKFLLHDPDEGPYIEYDKKIAEKAYNHPIIADDLFVGLGKK